MLDGEVPGVHSWKPDRVRDHESRYAVRQHVVAVRTLGLRRENGGRVERIGPFVQCEYGVEVVGRLDGLNAENRQILRDVVAENRPENAQVISAAIAGADHRFRGHLVRDAQPRSKVCQWGLHVQVEPDAVLPGDQDLAGADVDKSAIADAVDVLRPVYFPAQSVIDGQLWVTFH